MNREIETTAMAPDYPIRLSVAGGDGIRMSRVDEERLIRDAARSGIHFGRIATRDDYDFAVLVAARDDHEADEKAAAAEALLKRIFGE